VRETPERGLLFAKAPVNRGCEGAHRGEGVKKLTSPPSLTGGRGRGSYRTR